MPNLISQKTIEKKIYLIRGQKVMLDRDLADLYGVETRVLNQAVRRNIDRFPEDFMFSLTREEIMNLSQIVISSKIKHAPNVFVFAEQGVAMLSSVLNSKQAIQVNIGIMRVFVNIRKLVSSNKEVINRLNQLEEKVEKQGKEIKRDIKTIFEVIHRPLLPSATTLISPLKPFSNKMAIFDVIKSCEGYIYWIDKYFSSLGLKLLLQALDNEKVKQIKILTSIDKVDEKIMDLFKDFKVELKNKGISCEMRVITDKKIKANIHDRWIISKDKCFNVPSTDTLARGQYSEVKETTNKPPFNEWWERSEKL
ncbi:MAG: ORF6N domain-containing protein [Candidatus Firestonebacteria bacterium]